MRRWFLSWLLMLAMVSPALAVVNETGTGTVPKSVQACSGGADKVIAGSSSATSYAIRPEGADIRCNEGTAADAAANPAPSATAGWLIKSDEVHFEGAHSVTLRLDCCGVAGVVPVDTWHK